MAAGVIGSFPGLSMGPGYGSSANTGFPGLNTGSPGYGAGSYLPGMGAGRGIPNNFGPPPTSDMTPVSPSQALTNQYKLYDVGVGQNASLYDQIQQGYSNLGATNITPRTYTPQTYQFSQTPDYRGAVSNLQGLAQTGGYSTQDIADMRARGISPIRAIYARAQANLNRNRALQGGYSPNYAAATAKMARDESQQISDATQNVNAQLAQMIAQNKLAIAPELASTTAGEQALQNQYGAQAVNTANQGQMWNVQNLQDIDRQNLGSRIQSLEGLRSLYGTTPALASLFGDQAMRTAGLVQNATNDQIAAGSNLARIAMGMR